MRHSVHVCLLIHMKGGQFQFIKKNGDWGEEFSYYAAINTEMAYPLQCVTCGESHGFSLFCVAECGE